MIEDLLRAAATGKNPDLSEKQRYTAAREYFLWEVNCPGYVKGDLSEEVIKKLDRLVEQYGMKKTFENRRDGETQRRGLFANKITSTIRGI